MNTESEQPLQHENNPEIVEAELKRLLGERRFAGAPQMSAFLKYIVKQTLTGKADRIKAYSVGVDALGKPDTFDAQTDPSVRVLALRLRKTLKAAYANATDNLAIIELKVGTYVPEFYKPDAAHSDNLLAASITREALLQQNSLRLASTSQVSKQPENVFAVNQDISVKPIRDSDTAAQSSIDTGVPSGAPTQPRKPDTLKRSALNVAGDVKEQWLIPNKLWFLVAATLLAAAWQISLTQSANGGFSNGLSLPLLPASAGYAVMPGDSESLAGELVMVAARPSVPTVYIELSDQQRELDRQLMLLLSSSFVQQGTISVVRREDSVLNKQRQYWPGEYQLVVNGFVVEGDMRVDTQLVSLSTGEMLYADTMMLDDFEQTFSARNLLTIESMASSLGSLEGPIYQDYCASVDNSRQSDCPSG